jgi:hypothetical protein
MIRGPSRMLACCCPPPWRSGWGIEQATDQLVDLGDRTGAARPGRKLLTLVLAMVAGGDCIDDVELLRAGSTASVLGHRVMAASTSGPSCEGSPSGTSGSSTR